MSFDGSSVELLLESPVVVSFDPLGIDVIRDELGNLPPNARTDIALFLERVNSNFPLMGSYEVVDFKPGNYTLDPRDIKKFGDEDDGLDYEGLDEVGQEPPGHPFFSVDSGTAMIVGFSHLPRFVDLLTWESYDLALQDDKAFIRTVRELTNSLGGPFFALISGVDMPGMEFDGDGTYTLKAGALRPKDHS
jgi:hypothetical protein